MSFDLKIVFTSPVRLKSIFTLKNKLPKMLLSGLFYKYKRGGYNATYYGKTKRHFKVRICEHLGISHLTEKKVKIDNKLVPTQEHLWCCNHFPSFEDYFILTMESNDFKLKTMESLLTALDKTVLSKADSSMPLELSDITSVVIICFITYDAHLSHFAYTIVVCSVLSVTSFSLLSKIECMSI